MSKVFSRDMSKYKGILNPPDPPTSKGDQDQVLSLQLNDFVCVYDAHKAIQMHRLGFVLAKTHCDGALWPYARAQWADDGLARWALRSDLIFFDSLMRAMHGGELVKSAEADVHVRQLIGTLKERESLTFEEIEAIEAMARLGTGAQLLRFLESI